MKIKEFISVPKINLDTTSSGTIYSISDEDQTQDIVPQDIVGSHPDLSAIAEGVSQIFRRQKGKAPVKGFRCTSGPRKGRICLIRCLISMRRIVVVFLCPIS